MEWFKIFLSITTHLKNSKTPKLIGTMLWYLLLLMDAYILIAGLKLYQRKNKRPGRRLSYNSIRHPIHMDCMRTFAAEIQ